MDRISEWKRRDEERRRELEEKRKREQEEEIRRLREQEKEEKEKRKEKAEKSEEVHSDSDSSAEDEVAKRGRKGRTKAPSSSDSELELEKEVSEEPWGAGNSQPACQLCRDPSGVLHYPGVACAALERVMSVGTSLPCKGELFPSSGHPVWLWVLCLWDSPSHCSHWICSTALPGVWGSISQTGLKQKEGLKSMLPVVRGKVSLASPPCGEAAGRRGGRARKAA